MPGIGKSRLVSELLALVEAEPELTTWRQGRSLPYGEGVALWALGEIVKAQAGILDTDPAEEAAAKLDRAVADLLDDAEAAWVAGHLRPLVGLAGAGESGGDRQAEAFAAWRRFLEALAERGPTVLVFEDLHWADDALLDFLDHLVDWAADVPLLVVCTARPELLARRPGWGGGKPNAATVSLAPLSEATPPGWSPPCSTRRCCRPRPRRAAGPGRRATRCMPRSTCGCSPTAATCQGRGKLAAGTPTSCRCPSRSRASSPPAWTRWRPRRRRCCRMPPCWARSAGSAPWPPSAAPSRRAGGAAACPGAP